MTETANKLSTSQTAWSAWEGEAQLPSIESLEHMAISMVLPQICSLDTPSKVVYQPLLRFHWKHCLYSMAYQSELQNMDGFYPEIIRLRKRLCIDCSMYRRFCLLYFLNRMPINIQF